MHGGVILILIPILIPVPKVAPGKEKKKGEQGAIRARSDAVVAVHVTTYVPQDHVEDEQDGENEQGNQDRFGHR